MPGILTKMHLPNINSNVTVCMYTGVHSKSEICYCVIHFTAQPLLDLAVWTKHCQTMKQIWEQKCKFLCTFLRLSTLFERFPVLLDILYSYSCGMLRGCMVVVVWSLFNVSVGYLHSDTPYKNVYCMFVYICSFLILKKLYIVCSQFSLLWTKHGVCTILPVLYVIRRWTRRPSSMSVIWSQYARNVTTSFLMNCGVDCAKHMSRHRRKHLFRYLILLGCITQFVVWKFVVMFNPSYVHQLVTISIQLNTFTALPPHRFCLLCWLFFHKTRWKRMNFLLL